MIDNVLFKKIEKRVSNGLKFINYDASLTKKEFNKSLSENEDILEIDQKIADCNADIEKYENKILEKFNEISKEVFFGEDKSIWKPYYKAMSTFHDFFDSYDINYRFTKAFYRNIIDWGDLKAINNLEETTIREFSNFINVAVCITKKELTTDMELAEKVAKRAESRLSKFNKVSSAIDKMKIKNEKLIEKVNSKIEQYSTICNSYKELVPAAAKIEEKLNNEVEAFNVMVKLPESVDFTLYKNAVKVREAHMKHKENLIESIKENSKELGHISKIRSEENIKELVKNSVSDVELRVLKRDSKFMFDLGMAKKSEIKDRATKLTVDYLAEKLISNEQEISK